MNAALPRRPASGRWPLQPSGWSNACLCGVCSQDGAGTEHGWKAMGGWKLGNTIDGCQAEFVLVPDAMASLAPVPDDLSDEQVLRVSGHHVDGLQRPGNRRHRDRLAMARQMGADGGRSCHRQWPGRPGGRDHAAHTSPRG
jgi:hypothetical protein